MVLERNEAETQKSRTEWIEQKEKERKKKLGSAAHFRFSFFFLLLRRLPLPFGPFTFYFSAIHPIVFSSNGVSTVVVVVVDVLVCSIFVTQKFSNKWSVGRVCMCGVSAHFRMCEFTQWIVYLFISWRRNRKYSRRTRLTQGETQNKFEERRTRKWEFFLFRSKIYRFRLVS